MLILVQNTCFFFFFHEMWRYSANNLILKNQQVSPPACVTVTLLQRQKTWDKEAVRSSEWGARGEELRVRDILKTAKLRLKVAPVSSQWSSRKTLLLERNTSLLHNGWRKSPQVHSNVLSLWDLHTKQWNDPKKNLNKIQRKVKADWEKHFLQRPFCAAPVTWQQGTLQWNTLPLFKGKATIQQDYKAIGKHSNKWQSHHSFL